MNASKTLVMPPKRPLIILTGPTAVGKTALSISLAKAIGGEIICADSIQVYRHMDIGSAKIMPDEMQGVPHHMIDMLDPTEEFNVVVFKQHAKRCMEEIYSRQHIPILVGGTGFYIQALLYDIDFTKQQEHGPIRQRLEAVAQDKGSEYLHHMLARVDPVSAEIIHANNQKRVIRALEYYELTGEPISAHNEAQHARQSAYDSYYFVLNEDRARLYDRIDKRVDSMMDNGLVEEVRSLIALGCKREHTSMQGLGYKEILDYLNGDISLERAVYLIKRDTRHFAKRQLTWFRREKEVIWLDKEAFGHDEQRILDHILQLLKNFSSP